MSEREVTFVTYLKLTRNPSFLVFTEGSKQCEELTRNVKHLYPGHNKTRRFTEILVAITIIARPISRYQAIRKANFNVQGLADKSAQDTTASRSIRGASRIEKSIPKESANLKPWSRVGK